MARVFCAAANPEAIELGDEEDQEGADDVAPIEADAEIVQAAVPDAVFGSVAAAAASEGMHLQPNTSPSSCSTVCHCSSCSTMYRSSSCSTVCHSSSCSAICVEFPLA